MLRGMVELNPFLIFIIKRTYNRILKEELSAE